MLITSPKLHNIGQHMQVVDWSHVCICPKFFCLSSAFFYLAKLPQKEKLEFTNSKKKVILEAFNPQK
jgi:hypothetical protein